jgi:translation initiation factor 1 (eIF-1/SUI1)
MPRTIWRTRVQYHSMSSDNPFRDLFAKAGIEGTTDDPDSLPDLDKNGDEIKEVVLGYERRGSGKVITTVRDIPAEKMDETLKFIKKTLGTGGSIDNELLAIQGDRRTQLTRFFEKQGIRVRGDRD